MMKCWGCRLANQIEGRKPDGQRQFGCFHDCACCCDGLISALPAWIAFESSATHKAMERPCAAWATKAAGPADLGQRLLALDLRSVELQELGHGEPLLELNGVAAQDRSSTRVPHGGRSRSRLHNQIHLSLGVLALKSLVDSAAVWCHRVRLPTGLCGAGRHTACFSIFTIDSASLLPVARARPGGEFDCFCLGERQLLIAVPSSGG